MILLGQQLVMGMAAIRTTDANGRLIAAFRQGQRTPPMTATIHPDLAHAPALSECRRRDGLYQQPSPAP